ncbi:hypothetical protein ACC687_41920, partial [Rhizobium ruizarguesonis]
SALALFSSFEGTVMMNEASNGAGHGSGGWGPCGFSEGSKSGVQTRFLGRFTSIASAISSA